MAEMLCPFPCGSVQKPLLVSTIHMYVCAMLTCAQQPGRCAQIMYTTTTMMNGRITTETKLKCYPSNKPPTLMMAKSRRQWRRRRRRLPRRQQRIFSEGEAVVRRLSCVVVALLPSATSKVGMRYDFSHTHHRTGKFSSHHCQHRNHHHPIMSSSFHILLKAVVGILFVPPIRCKMSIIQPAHLYYALQRSIFMEKTLSFVIQIGC